MSLRKLLLPLRHCRLIKPPLPIHLRRLSREVPQEKPTDADLLGAFTSPEGEPIISGRPYLPGGFGQNMPRYLSGPRDDFPLLVDMASLTSTEKLTPDLAVKTKAILHENLPRYGAVLLRGLPLNHGGDVATLNNLMGAVTMTYQGGNAVRERVNSHVMTASNEPPCYTIEPHNEMSYLPKWPTYISFYCDVPAKPGHGGESVLVANRDFQNEIDPEVKEKFKRLGVRYNNYTSGRGDDCYLPWQEIFETEDKATAERVMTSQGYAYQWQDNGYLRYWFNLPATRPHHKTGEEIWFNQMHCSASYFRAHPEWGLSDLPDDEMPYHSYYGDGTEIHPDVIQHVRDVTWKHAVGVQMQKGELIFLDNMLGQHGRLGYVGERRLLVTLFEKF